GADPAAQLLVQSAAGHPRRFRGVDRGRCPRGRHAARRRARGPGRRGNTPALPAAGRGVLRNPSDATPAAVRRLAGGISFQTTASISPARYVPYGFARTHQVLISGVSGDAMEVWIGESTPLTALTELSRTLPYRLVPVRKGAKELAAAISRAYAQQEGSAASVV